jgi:Protein of unknown function (DUF1571)
MLTHRASLNCALFEHVGDPMTPARRLLSTATLALALSPWTGASLAAEASQPSVDEQGRALCQRLKSGELSGLGDAAAVRVFQGLPPAALAHCLQAMVDPLSSYELWVQRQERIDGSWNAKPWLNHLKYTHEPRRIYVKWLDGGPKAGQEMIYDETRRKDQIYGHLGGFMNVTSAWLSLDSSIIRSNTNHNLRDELNLQFFVRTVKQRLMGMQASGASPKAIEVVSQAGKRQVSITLPPGVGTAARPYTGKLRFAIDIDQAMVRQFEAWDAADTLIERVVVDRLKPTPLDAADFDPDNKAYNF